MKTESSWNSSSSANRPDATSKSLETRIFQFTGEVVENRLVSSSTHRIDLSIPHRDSLRVKPGEFFMIRTGPFLDPLLRRPFSVHSMGRLGARVERLSILFRVVGQGTQLMATWRKGQPVDMVGPLGRGYRIPEDLGTVAMVAGGLGIASLFGLAQSILQRKKGADVRICIGGNSKTDILMKPELESMGAKVNVTTEDGSIGMRGVATDWLEAESLQLASERDTVVYACGPLGMLAKVNTVTERFSIPCQVSLEARMACGVGSCLGCAVKARDQGYHMVCKDGPVFDADEIDWERTKRLI
ncbi:MAG: dihydroorotate dehydrogenase electron transfer subunit [Proteobacteria bacterium]|nr:dihydroorotate dehydrogenase electron transfer subunit [Pseudomonadota bacterium]NIS70938.1 dihydroorotate dehydrogenase electron transfer subunit [Pseudomonadota bacterium]